MTLRSIYYHLKKGVALGEFRIESVQKEKGDYSWGAEVEKIYYALGENAKPTGNERVREYMSKQGSTQGNGLAREMRWLAGEPGL